MSANYNHRTIVHHPLSSSSTMDMSPSDSTKFCMAVGKLIPTFSSSSSSSSSSFIQGNSHHHQNSIKVPPTNHGYVVEDDDEEEIDDDDDEIVMLVQREQVTGLQSGFNDCFIPLPPTIERIHTCQVMGSIFRDAPTQGEDIERFQKKLFK